ncbi:hypothetical protein GHK79_04700 [Enterococcus faecium]|uniref:hypothetical protein n=1 Tax=Enterococcus faecium TaxID=1352 RepID=UPI0019250A15|nr:hypothetical protein [Enterococcus faecium]EHK9937513.1 hypothetical protein [Enterococcus faecium]MBL3707126.1 hypothetical protein [Enterococcus faecium]
MKDFGWIFGLIVAIVGLGAVGIFYQTESNSQDSLVLAINETVKASAMDHLNNVVRTKEGTSQLDIPAFEKDTKERLFTVIGSKRKAKKVKFSYLKATDTLKAVRVKMTTDDNVNYQTTYYFDVTKEFH